MLKTLIKSAVCMMCALSVWAAMAQTRTVTGKVLDTGGQRCRTLLHRQHRHLLEIGNTPLGI